AASRSHRSSSVGCRRWSGRFSFGRSRCLNSNGHEKLADVTLGMFGRMDEESQLCRRQFIAADGARLGKRSFIRSAKLVDRGIDLTPECVDEIMCGDVGV